MSLSVDPGQLAALAEVLRAGSFEAAAARLGVTPSAVSQRIRAIEDRVGALVLIREKPCRPTALGQRLLQHFEAMMILQAKARADIGAPPKPAVLRVALAEDVDAPRVLAALSRSEGLFLDLVTGSDADCLCWLQAGEVTAALSRHAERIEGFDRIDLGPVPHVAVASPGYFAAHLDPLHSPWLKLNAQDGLPELWARNAGLDPPQSFHLVPSTQAILEAARLGLGLAVVRASAVAEDVSQGRLIPVAAKSLTLPLFWHRRASLAPALEAFEADLLRYKTG